MSNCMKIFSVVIFIVLTSVAPAAAQYWAKTYGTDQDEFISKVLQTNDGGFVSAGLGDDYGFMLLKLNPEGNIQWQNSYEGHLYGNLKSPTIESLQQTRDGGYIATARPVYFALSAIRFDSSGNIVWQKPFRRDCARFLASDIKETTDGFILTYSQDYVLRVLKLDSDGDVDWNMRYGEYEHDLIFSGGHTIEQTDDDNDGMKDDGFILTGLRREPWGGAVYPLILKLDRFGNISWQKEFILPSYEGFNIRTFHQTMDGSYIGAGLVYLSRGDDNYLDEADTADILIFKCDIVVISCGIKSTEPKALI